MTGVRWLPSLYKQVLIAIVFGVFVGICWPGFGQNLKFLSEGFLRLIKMLLPLLVFITVVTGVAPRGNHATVGRVALKALVYFEVLTTLALVLGLVLARTFQPGAGLHINPATLDTSALPSLPSTSKASSGGSGFLVSIIPENVVDAFAKGDMLQVLFFAVLFGFALGAIEKTGGPLSTLIERLSKVLFQIIHGVMYLAPLGAFGAMAFTVGKYGLAPLGSLAKLMVVFYATCLLFIVGVLGSVLRFGVKLSPWALVRYLKEELLIVVGTSSSETVMPQLIEKLEALGASKSVVTLVVPTGYSFNLDGTCIFMTMAALFVAQATDTPLRLSEQLGLLGLLLVTSKGAAAFTGSAFLTLAATLASTGKIPVAGLTLLLGVDRFMSEARAITNLLGNSVATLFVASWEKQLDIEQAKRVLSSLDTVSDPVE